MNSCWAGRCELTERISAGLPSLLWTDTSQTLLVHLNNPVECRGAKGFCMGTTTCPRAAGVGIASLMILATLNSFLTFVLRRSSGRGKVEGGGGRSAKMKSQACFLILENWD